MAKESGTISDLFVDDLYFSALDFEENIDDLDFQVSDSRFAEELQFQEALMASIITSQTTPGTSTSSPTSSQMMTTTTIQASLQPEPPQPTVMMIIAAEPEPALAPAPACESSQSFFCEICVERKEADEMFNNESCINHSYCCDCISKHVAAKLRDSSSKKAVVTCPGVDCKSVLEIDACREALPKEVAELWEEVLCEVLIDESAERFYCPYNDCSALMLRENGEVIVEAECPVCHRLFCAQCSVSWHSGVECEEFQRLNEDERGREDLMVVEIARENKWTRCPHCKFYVERTEGCPHITCRCSFQFCYGCGSEWSDTHGGCQRV